LLNTWALPAPKTPVRVVGFRFFFGLLTGETPEEAVKLGWAHGALLTTFPGDTTMATVDQVRSFAKGGSARIQR
jgi:2-dehydro-3-deoxygluconokinase